MAIPASVLSAQLLSLYDASPPLTNGLAVHEDRLPSLLFSTPQVRRLLAFFCFVVRTRSGRARGYVELGFVMSGMGQCNDGCIMIELGQANALFV